MKHLFRNLLVLACMLGATGTLLAQQQMPTIPIDPNVRIGKLTNGMTYYIRKNALPEKRADFYIAQKVGSILEEDSQRGLAHFLEHMAFNGTKNFPGNEKGLGVIPWCETIGVKFGANLNAYTSVDETVYNISNAPVIRDGIIDSCLLILHDWSNSLKLDDKEIDKERGVIHEEWRTRQSAMMRMYEKAFPEIYPNSKYAHRLPIGTMEVVDNFPYQVLRDYYHKWYRPDLQGIIVVGDINVDEIEAKVKKIFSDIPAPVNPAERVYFPVPDNKEPIITIQKDKEQANVQILVFNKHEVVPNEAKTSLNYMVMNYATNMINQMLNARLNELTQSATAPFMYAVTYDDDFFVSKTKNAFTGIAVSKEDGIETALAALMRETERARKFGFNESEYVRAKADYLRGLESAFNEKDKEKNKSYVNEYVRHFIDNEPTPGIDYEYATMNQIAPNIPVAAINQMMQELVQDSNLVVSIFAPDKEGVVYPTKENIMKVIAAVKTEKLTAYEDKVSNEPLIAEKPTAGKVVSEKSDVFGTTTLTLSNGVKVVLKKTDFKADEIRMKAFSPGGNSLFPDSEVTNFKLLNDVIEIGGLGNFTAVELEKVLAGKKASVTPGVETNTESLNGYCSPKDLETMLQLVYLNFTAPRMDADAFTSYKNRTRSALLNQETNPMSTFVDTIQSSIFGKHPRSIRVKAELIDQIDYQKTMDMYKDRFSDASDFTFMLVGNIDVDAARPLLEEYLGSLPSINRKETFKDTKNNMRKGYYHNKFARTMETPKNSVFVFYNGKCKYNLENDIQLDMLTQILDLVYTAEVREKEGGTYGVSVNGSLNKFPKEKHVIEIMFDTDPAKCDKMLSIIVAEANKLATDGPSIENLNKVKEYMLKKHKEDVKENSYWLNVLNEYNYAKSDMNSNYEEIVNKMDAKRIQKFAKMIFGQKNQIEVVMSAK